MPATAQGPVGISVSGGGLRAAAFGLGVLQALQHRRGLLRGGRAADLLSAVSGGSYIAGAYTLVNCSDRLAPAGGDDGGAVIRDGDLPPFAPASPEAAHLRRHCRYMIEDGGLITSLRFAGLSLLNLLTVVSIAVWVGVLPIGDFALVASWVLPPEVDSPQGWASLQWPLAVVGIVMFAALASSSGRPRLAGESSGKPKRWLLLLGLPIHAAAMAALLARVETVPVLRSPAWVLHHSHIIVVGIAATALLTCLALAASRRMPFGSIPLRRVGDLGVVLLTRGLVWGMATLLVVWSAAFIYGGVSHAPGLFLIAFFAGLSAPLLLQPLIDRASPHHAYRDMLTRCFSVIRTGDGNAARPEAPRDVLLSQLAPPAEGEGERFPELVICAAANVSNIGATPAGSNVLSLVITPHEIAVPAIPEARAPVDRLERLRRPRSLLPGRSPALTLASAVAMTGAAVSPAMGRMTRRNLRVLFAALNVRLGVWIPNILSPAVREGLYAADPPKRDVRVNLDDLVAELLGSHDATWPKLYVTDGGHYDNLGLVELLRRHCRRIWCIDASGDRPGTARALAEAILLAAAEHGIGVSIELDRFAVADGSTAADPLLSESSAIGTITYEDGTTGELVVGSGSRKRARPSCTSTAATTAGSRTTRPSTRSTAASASTPIARSVGVRAYVRSTSGNAAMPRTRRSPAPYSRVTAREMRAHRRASSRRRRDARASLCSRAATDEPRLLPFDDLATLARPGRPPGRFRSRVEAAVVPNAQLVRRS